MKITVKHFGRTFSKEMSIEDLIRAYAETMAGYEGLSLLDGYIDAMRPVEVFVDDCYACIVNGVPCEICDDDLPTFDFVFPDSVRFETTEKIKGIIRDSYLIVLEGVE